MTDDFAYWSLWQREAAFTQRCPLGLWDYGIIKPSVVKTERVRDGSHAGSISETLHSLSLFSGYLLPDQPTNF